MENNNFTGNCTISKFAVRYRRGSTYYVRKFDDKEAADNFASRIEDEGFQDGYEFLSIDTEQKEEQL